MMYGRLPLDKVQYMHISAFVMDYLSRLCLYFCRGRQKILMTICYSLLTIVLTMKAAATVGDRPESDLKISVDSHYNMQHTPFAVLSQQFIMASSHSIVIKTRNDTVN